MIHPLAEVARDTQIGRGTKVWQFASVIRGARIGENCNIAACAIVDGATLGDGCLVGHCASIHPGAKIGHRVFVGPLEMFCNDAWPSVGKDGFDPIRLVVRHHEPSEVFELFRAADMCIVSSLHDGMNLVAKEFVAARDDEQGVLVLSSFTGASREMSEALIVNPYHAQEMAQAIETALSMPAQEQRERIRVMRQQVQERNVYRWAGRMLLDAAQVRQRQRILDIGNRNREQ